MNRSIKNLLFVLTVLFLTLITSSCSILPEEKDVFAVKLNNVEKFQYNCLEVQKKTYIKKVEGEGTIEPSKKINVSFDSGGCFVKKIYAGTGDFVRKGSILVEANTDELDYKIKKQENSLKLAKINYEQVQSLSLDKLEVEKAKISLEIEKSKLDNLKLLHGKMRLVSPMDGIIIYSKDMRKGSQINANEMIFQIADTRDIQIIYKSKDVSLLKIGMKVNVQYGSEYFSGEVVKVDITNITVRKTNNSLSSACIKLFNIPENIQIGESVKLAIEAMKKDNVMVIPGSAITIRDGKSYVVVLENNTRVEKQIRTGFEIGYDVEVLDGLNAGDKIIID